MAQKSTAEIYSGKICKALYSDKLVVRDNDGNEVEIRDQAQGEAILNIMRRNFTRGYRIAQSDMRGALGL